MKTFAENIRKAIAAGLPGTDIQWMMASSDRLIKDFPRFPGPDAREAGVLILLWPGSEGISTLFIQRPVYEGIHSGQIAFPGGKREPGDENIIMTALREAEEETGIKSSEVEVAGTLTPLFIPVSNTIVTPVVGWTDKMPGFRHDPGEVVYLIIAGLSRFLDPSIIRVKPQEIRGQLFDIKYFDYEGNVIWGATAMILNELLEIIKKDNVLLRTLSRG